LSNASESLFSLNINLIEMQWLQVLSEGWAHPLTGFMTEDEYLECMHFKSITKNGKAPAPVQRGLRSHSSV
jgi:3'-phosphoadenosine 5'-phosphosulfate synthase